MTTGRSDEPYFELTGEAVLESYPEGGSITHMDDIPSYEIAEGLFISPRTAQPCGTSRETVLPNVAALGELMAKMRIQNRAARLYRSSPVRSAIVFQRTMMSASPMVSCGNRSW